MDKLRTMVKFQSTKFNSTVSKDYFINDGCFGDDVAIWIMQELKQKGIETDSQPAQEDFGWYFNYKMGGQEYRFVIGFQPADEGVPSSWMGWVEKKAGMLSSMFGGRSKGIQPEAVQAIHTVLSSSTDIQDIRWHFTSGFDDSEDSGTPTPF